MGQLVYSLNVSLDGFVETVDRGLEWALVDEEVHGWFNDEARRQDAFVYGRRMYELMVAYWPTAESDPGATEAMVDFARIWKPKPKVVFSSTLESVEWNSRLVRGDVVAEVARLRDEYPGQLGVGGAALAAELIRHDLIDEFQLLVHPVALGAGTPFFPPLPRPLELELVETRRFAAGVVYLGYRRR